MQLDQKLTTLSTVALVSASPSGTLRVMHCQTGAAVPATQHCTMPHRAFSTAWTRSITLPYVHHAAILSSCTRASNFFTSSMQPAATQQADAHPQSPRGFQQLPGPINILPAKKGSGSKSKAPNKADLPSKVCLTCGRPFTWRKKWEKVWDEVKYCSDRCRGSRPSPTGQPDSTAAC